MARDARSHPYLHGGRRYLTTVAAESEEPYTGMLEQLRLEIAAGLPLLEDSMHKGIVEAQDAKTRDSPMLVNPLFPFPDRLPSVFSALSEKAIS